MTQEDKELLLKDLCSRLPYRVKYKDAHGYKEILDVWKLNTALNTILHDEKPSLYLRPMSSMTKEEKKELNNVLEYQYYSDDSCMCESTDWLNAHHFDYRGLIDKGLAIAVTEDNNPYKD